MKENQNIEWKESWRDEYLKWICGFANAQGGLLIIGKNDTGIIKGINDAEKLLEDIPNKVRDVLGILVDVNLKTEDSKDYLEIQVEPHQHPVSYKGQYHYRSGSTKQELKGSSLEQFLLKKQGRTWDSVAIPNIKKTDFKNDTFDLFLKKAYQSKRLEQNINYSSHEILLDKLNLIEGEYFKRATILLFHSNPEKYFAGSYIKLGFFENDYTLKYQDEIHGNLFEQIEKTMDFLLTKYMKAYISYKGLQRLENYLFPESALREALLNAVAHKDYNSSIPIQIKVYEDQIIFFNEGFLPENWTIENLKKVHSSKPFNPNIANTLFRSGYIESWGSGTIKIINECLNYKLPEPIYDYDSSTFSVKFYTDKNIKKVSVKTSVKTSVKILFYISEKPEITIPELAEKIGITERSIERNIQKLQKENKLERIGSNKSGIWKVK